jgi:hypothetical protein
MISAEDYLKTRNVISNIDCEIRKNIINPVWPIVAPYVPDVFNVLTELGWYIDLDGDFMNIHPRKP